MKRETMFRLKVALSLWVILLFVGGLMLQHKWDSECAAQDPGTRWDSELWYCRDAG